MQEYIHKTAIFDLELVRISRNAQVPITLALFIIFSKCYLHRLEHKCDKEKKKAIKDTFKSTT